MKHSYTKGKTMNALKSLVVALLLAGNLANSTTQAATPINLYQGTWDANATYQIGNIVTYQNQTFLSLISRNTGRTPGSDATAWQIVGANIQIGRAHV